MRGGQAEGAQFVTTVEGSTVRYDSHSHAQYAAAVVAGVQLCASPTVTSTDARRRSRSERRALHNAGTYVAVAVARHAAQLVRQAVRKAQGCGSRGRAGA